MGQTSRVELLLIVIEIYFHIHIQFNFYYFHSVALSVDKIPSIQVGVAEVVKV